MKIHIIGYPGEGKSKIARLIVRALAENGVTSVLDDDADLREFKITGWPSKSERAFFERLNVSVETVRLRKNGLESKRKGNQLLKVTPEDLRTLKRAR